MDSHFHHLKLQQIQMHWLDGWLVLLLLLPFNLLLSLLLLCLQIKVFVRLTISTHSYDQIYNESFLLPLRLDIIIERMWFGRFRYLLGSCEFFW